MLLLLEYSPRDIQVIQDHEERKEKMAILGQREHMDILGTPEHLENRLTNNLK